jgi:hypothetical protein
VLLSVSPVCAQQEAFELYPLMMDRLYPATTEYVSAASCGLTCNTITMPQLCTQQQQVLPLTRPVDLVFSRTPRGGWCGGTGVYRYAGIEGVSTPNQISHLGGKVCGPGSRCKPKVAPERQTTRELSQL